MTTTAPTGAARTHGSGPTSSGPTSSGPTRSNLATEQKGLAGIAARLRNGRASGYGIFHPGSWTMLIAGMMMIVSAFLPWVYVTLTQEIIGEAFVLRGTDGPGVITLSVGCVAFAGAFVPMRRLAIAHAAIPGMVVGIICVLQFGNIIMASVATQWGSFVPGMGLVLASGAAVLLLKCSWTMWKRWPKSTG